MLPLQTSLKAKKKNDGFKPGASDVAPLNLDICVWETDFLKLKKKSTTKTISTA